MGEAASRCRGPPFLPARACVGLGFAEAAVSQRVGPKEEFVKVRKKDLERLTTEVMQIRDFLPRILNGDVLESFQKLKLAQQSECRRRGVAPAPRVDGSGQPRVAPRRRKAPPPRPAGLPGGAAAQAGVLPRVPPSAPTQRGALGARRGRGRVPREPPRPCGDLWPLQPLPLVAR